MSPVSAWISPELETLPAVLSLLRAGVTSLPRVLDCWLLSVPRPLRITKLSPAASVVCPPGVTMVPRLCASRPASST
ncbi:hypothetical protein D9M72_638700 [compost metagenome]